MTDVLIVKLNYQHASIITDIRQTVFSIKQKIDASKDLDGEDPEAIPGYNLPVINVYLLA